MSSRRRAIKRERATPNRARATRLPTSAVPRRRRAGRSTFAAPKPFMRSKHQTNRWGKLVNVKQSMAAKARFQRDGPPANWAPFRRGHVPVNKGRRGQRFPRRHMRVPGRGFVNKNQSAAATRRFRRDGLPAKMRPFVKGGGRRAAPSRKRGRTTAARAPARKRVRLTAPAAPSRKRSRLSRDRSGDVLMTDRRTKARRRV
jgi:hypothetical protein